MEVIIKKGDRFFIKKNNWKKMAVIKKEMK